MKNYVRWTLFIAMVLAQLFIPVWMIFSSENILAMGARYQFKTAPVDPEDAFRGKYVRLSFTANTCSVDSTVKFKPNQKVFAIINRDIDGFAQVTGLARHKPAGGDYVKVKVNYQNGHIVTFRYPFEKYFIDEEKASKAEQLYREYNNSAQKNSYLIVRVKNGKAVVEELILGGLPVREALQKKIKK